MLSDFLDLRTTTTTTPATTTVTTTAATASATLTTTTITTFSHLIFISNSIWCHSLISFIYVVASCNFIAWLKYKISRIRILITDPENFIDKRPWPFDPGHYLVNNRNTFIVLKKLLIFLFHFLITNREILLSYVLESFVLRRLFKFQGRFSLTLSGINE